MDTRYTRLLAALIGFAAAVYFTISVIQDFLGPFSATLRIVGALLIAVAVAVPRLGIYILFFELCYIDMIKRLAVYVDGPIFMITVQTLAIPQLTLAAVCAVIFWKAFQEGQLRGRHYIMLLLVVTFSALLVVIGRTTGEGTFGAIRTALGTAGFGVIILLIDLQSRNSDEVLKFIRVFLWIMLPVALYGIWQSFFGFAEFEYYYAMTGFTITSEEMFGGVPRPFSTLNSVSAFASIGLMAAFAWWTAFNFKYKRWIYFLLALIFTYATIRGMTRGTQILLIVALVASWVMLKPGRTIVLYAIGGLVAFSFFWFSPHLYQNLERYNTAWLEFLDVQTDRQRKQFSLATTSDRLHGLSRLRESTTYTMFGKVGKKLGLESNADGDEGLYDSHDMLNSMMRSVGVFGLLVGALFLVTTTLAAHYYYFRTHDRRAIRLGAFVMAVLVPFIGMSLLAGNILGVSPINFILFAYAGTLFTYCRLIKEENRELVALPAEPQPVEPEQLPAT